MTSLREGSDKGGLRGWFQGGGWDRYDSKGNKIGKCGGRKPGEAKPKCFSREKAAALGKKGRAQAVRRKRREDPNPNAKGKPINTPSTKRGLKRRKRKMRKDSSTDVNPNALIKLAENLVLKLLEKAKKDACYHKVKATAAKWPSAYASGRLVQCRNKGASNYGKSNSSTEIEGDSLTEIRGKHALKRFKQAQKAAYEAKPRKVYKPFEVSAKTRLKAAKAGRRTARRPLGDEDQALIKAADAENRAQQQHSSTEIIGNSILEALKYLLETGEVKRRNKEAKREFMRKTGKPGLAYERGETEGYKSKGPRRRATARSNQRDAEAVAAGRLAFRDVKINPYSRKKKTTRRILRAGRKAAKYTPDDTPNDRK
jgi:hypothetical protein